MTPFELEQLVTAPVHEVVGVFRDPRRLVELHPLIERITVLHETAELVEFEVFERVPFGPFKVANTYRGSFAFSQRDGVQVMTLAANSQPSVVVSGEMRFTARGDDTLVNETVSFVGPWPLGGFVARTGGAAHRKQLIALAARFKR